MGLFPDKELTRGVLKVSTRAVAGLSSQVVVSAINTAMIGGFENTTVVPAAMGPGLLATRAITSAFSSIATVINVPVARRSGEGDHPGAGDVLDNFLVLSLALSLIFGLPGYQFSYDIINFFNATFLPRYRRTYKYYRRFRIRHEVILGPRTALPVHIVAYSGLIYLKYAKGSRSHIKV